MKQILHMITVLLLAVCLLAGGAATAAAAGEETTYVLTYPNGETVTTTDEAEAQKLLEEWKLLYTGTTDENGEISLEGWSDSGEILIRETVVPEGYTAETAETAAQLSDGSVTIVNRKTDDPPAPTATPSVPGTGDNGPWLWLGLLCASGAGLAAMAFSERKHKS